MKAPYSPVVLEGQVVARALAILVVVATHASSWTIGGGMLTLLFISGYNFIMFSRGKSNSQLAIYCLKYTKNIVLPSVAIICMYFIWYQKFSAAEILHYSNWVGTTSIAWMPVWYPSMILQVMALLTAIFLIFRPTRFIEDHSCKFCVVSFIVACLLYILSDVLVEAELAAADARLPFSYLWCFTHGWLAYSIHKSENAWLLPGFIILTAVSAAVFISWQSKHEALVFVPLVTLFLYNPKLQVPQILYSVFSVLAGASLYIFLFHMSFFYVYHTLTGWRHEETSFHLAMFSFSVVGCCVMWLVFTSGRKAWLETKRNLEGFRREV